MFPVNGNHGGANDRRRETSSSSSQRHKEYRVVQESVLQEKKKLKTEVCYSREPPRGYTFVPVGRPDLTDACRELARKENVLVFIVSDYIPRENQPEKVSDHVHRAGYHIPNRVVDAVLRHRDQSYTRPRARAYIPRANAIDEHFQAQTRRIGEAAGIDAAALTSNQRSEALRGAIKELFPLIPDEDRDAVVVRAFAEGKRVVGNSDLALSRKVQLAVLAHIRHVHTDYDALLKPFGWKDARRIIEELCLDMIKKWRGELAETDDEAEIVELEQVMREYVLIDDSSDEEAASSSDHKPTKPQPPKRRRRRSSSSSVEFVSERPRSNGHAHDPKRTRVGSPCPGPVSQRAQDEQRPQIVRPSTAQLVQPRPVRGPQPAQIVHLDELSRRYEQPAHSRPSPVYHQPRPTRLVPVEYAPAAQRYHNVPPVIANTPPAWPGPATSQPHHPRPLAWPVDPPPSSRVYRSVEHPAPLNDGPHDPRAYYGR